MPTHLLLTANDSREQAKTRVSHFFARNFLVKYDQAVIPEERIVNAADPDFWPQIEAGLAENNSIVTGLLNELQESGFRHLSDLSTMQQGYDSKILHLVTHLLDGFFGIDTCFYNLEEDAHSISDRLEQAIRRKPEGYWLVTAECDTASGHEASQLAMIRQFEVTPNSE